MNEESEDEKYSSFEHYLKNGWLGSTYQTFVDAVEVIDECDLQEDIRNLEISLEFFSLLRDPDPPSILEPYGSTN